jgi:hypothetical protein
MDEMRPGMPGRDVQLDQAITRHSEGGDVLDARTRVIAEVAWWCHPDQPFFAAERAQALRNPPMSCDPGEPESDMWQMHDPQPRLAISQNELCLAERGLGVVASLDALAARPQRRDHLAVGRANASAVNSLISSMCRNSVPASFIVASCNRESTQPTVAETAVST